MPRIVVRPSAAYRLSLWAFVDCDGLECENSLDSITVKINYNDKNVAEIVILSTDVVYDQEWRYFSLEFESTRGDVLVTIEVERSRLLSRIQTAFGVDDIKLEFLGGKL